MVTENQVVWRVRYVNEGEKKLRVVEIHTDTDSLDELFDELQQFESARILSIRNQTLKFERSAEKRK